MISESLAIFVMRILQMLWIPSKYVEMKGLRIAQQVWTSIIGIKIPIMSDVVHDDASQLQMVYRYVRQVNGYIFVHHAAVQIEACGMAWSDLI